MKSFALLILPAVACLGLSGCATVHNTVVSASNAESSASTKPVTAPARNVAGTAGTASRTGRSTGIVHASTSPTTVSPPPLTLVPARKPIKTTTTATETRTVIDVFDVPVTDRDIGR